MSTGEASAMSQMFYDVTLLDRQALTPGMVRLTFGGEGLKAFQTTGIGDEYLRLFFPNEETGKLHLPHITEDGRWTYPDGQDAVRCSTYTVRRFAQDGEDVTIDVDFVVHEGGMASEWAQKADEQILPHHGAATVTWLHGCGNGVAPSRLEEIVRGVPLPATPGYVWVAGEQKVVRGIRKFVRKELGFPPERYELVGYWIANSEDWEAKWDALDPAIKAQIDAGWDSGRDRETVMDEYIDTLEKHGL